jgi:hypothetical protein
MSNQTIIGYHGTHSEFDVFDVSKSKNGMIFFALEEGFAIDWVSERQGGIGRLICASITVNNAWDYAIGNHVSLLTEKMAKKGIVPLDQEKFDEDIADGEWSSIERTHGVIDLIKELGFDGIFITEGSDFDRNVAVFSANSIVITDIVSIDRFEISESQFNKKEALRK